MESEAAIRARLARTAQAWLDHAHVNPTDLHKQTGKSRDAFYRLLRGDGAALETLVAFANVVGTEVGDLLNGVLPAAVPSMLPGDALNGPGMESRSTESEPTPDVFQMNRDLRALAEEVARLRDLVESSGARDRRSAG